MGSERRRDTRHEKRIAVILRIEDTTYEGTTRNLSMGGAFVEVGLNIPAMKNPGVEIAFFLQTKNDAQPMICKGRICWMEGILPNGTGLGIQFQDLSEEQMALLESFLTNANGNGEVDSTTDFHRSAIENTLVRWVENGLLSTEEADKYRARICDDS